MLLAAATLAVVWRTARSEAAPDDESDRLVVRALPFACLGALVLVAVHTAWARPGAHSPRPAARRLRPSARSPSSRAPWSSRWP